MTNEKHQQEEMNCKTPMASCKAKIRYVPWFPLILGIVFLLLGYFLDPTTIRVLWMLGAGLIVGLGVIGLMAVRSMAAKDGSVCC